MKTASESLYLNGEFFTLQSLQHQNTLQPTLYTKAAIALHNFLRTTESSVYCPLAFLDAEDGDGNVVLGQRQEEGAPLVLKPIHSLGGNQHSVTAAAVRDTFRDFFCSPFREVSWQYRHIHRTN